MGRHTKENVWAVLEVYFRKKNKFKEENTHNEPIVTITEERLQQLLEKVARNKDFSEFQLMTMIHQKMGKYIFSYIIVNEKPVKGFKILELPKYDEVSGDPFLYIN